MPRAIQFLLTLAIGAFALWAAFRDVEGARFLAELRAVDVSTFAAGLLLFVALHVARAVRWGRLVQALRPGIRFRSYFSICSVGFFLINVLPFRLGEFVRPYLLYEREELPFGSGLATVIVERVLDVLALAVLLLGVVAFAELPLGSVTVRGRSWDVVAMGRTAILGALIPAGLGMAVLLLLGERGVRLARRLAAPLGARGADLVARFLETFLHALRSLGDPRRALPVLTWTGFVWALNTLSMVVMAWGFQFGDVMGFWEGATILVCICAVLIVPGPPGFVGVFELAVAISLALFHVGDSEAAAFAVLVHGGQFLVLGALGVAFLLLDRISVRRLLRAMQDLRAGPAGAGPRA